MPSKKTQKERKEREMGAAIPQREREQVVSYLAQEYLRE